MSTKMVLELLGGLAVFLFGMKLMSDSLQAVAGEKLKVFLGRMTANRFSGVLSGFAITAAIQSSSATTVMLVGFVNAGLLGLTNAIGVILGANIGTTVTAWIVALLGFKVKITMFALPAVAAGVIMTFTKRDNLKGWGNVLIGFGLLFLGLQFLKDSVPSPDTGNLESLPLYSFLQAFSGSDILSLLVYGGIGTLLTVIVQSSSATSAITITLAVNGMITPEGALAMILGENIGTTITANVAALAANRNSKKAALAHTIFNLSGVVWVLALFSVMFWLVDIVVPGDIRSPDVIGDHIAGFHTIFNVMNTLIMIWFVPQLASIVSRVVDSIARVKPEDDIDRFQLLYSGNISISELTSVELNEYIGSILKTSRQTFNEVNELCQNDYDPVSIAEIFQEEEELDKFRSNMLSILTDIQESGMSGRLATRVLVMIEHVKSIEEVGDLMARIARKMRKAHREDVGITGDYSKKLQVQLDLIKEQYELIVENLSDLSKPAIIRKSTSLNKRAVTTFQKYEKQARKLKKKKKTVILETLLFIDISRNLMFISNELNSIIEAEADFAA